MLKLQNKKSCRNNLNTDFGRGDSNILNLSSIS